MAGEIRGKKRHDLVFKHAKVDQAELFQGLRHQFPGRFFACRGVLRQVMQIRPGGESGSAAPSG